MKYVNIAACASLALGMAGCDRPEAPESNTDQAEQAGEEAGLIGADAEPVSVSEAELTYYLENRVRKPLEEVTEEERQQVREELKKLELVASEADEQGIADDPDVAARISLERKSILAQALIQRHLEENPVTEEELRAEYESQLAGSPPKEYKARHILLESKEEAEAVIEQLDEGADFAELATEKSTDPSATNGGDLGWFTPDRMVKPFADALAGMETGTYTKDPVQTQFGWHVILAEEKREATPPTFEAIKEQLRPAIEQRRVEELVEGLQEDPVQNQ
ncbi:MAG: peptidylprolyl isomerase [Gammaproteobacteria bacterium]|nr:peptidylprolyl isomerase [Gammaproteobacteria bacterium]